MWDGHAGVYPDPRTDLTGLETWRQVGDRYLIPALAASHPTAAILPALIALGEQRGAPGRSAFDKSTAGVIVRITV